MKLINVILMSIILMGGYQIVSVASMYSDKQVEIEVNP